VATTPSDDTDFAPGRRMELKIAFDGLIKRFPDLRLAVPESELPWYHGEITGVAKSPPAQWG
jgi:hypothetical protein